jgi:hypothetical protein
MKDNNSDKLILPLDDFGVIKKYQTKESNKELLDKSWGYVMDKIDTSTLWKLGTYTTKVYSMENNERGMFIERFFCEELGGVNIDDITTNNLRLKGVYVKYDFTIPNELQVNVKTTCVDKKLYNRIGQMTSSKSVKIFDTSRNKYSDDQLGSLKRQLNSIGWDITILFYGYEKSTNRYSLHLTSLKEMSETLFGDNSEENILKLFSYDKGGSHYFIDRANIYYVAKKNKREYYSDKVDIVMVDEYIGIKKEYMYDNVKDLIK